MVQKCARTHCGRLVPAGSWSHCCCYCRKWPHTGHTDYCDTAQPQPPKGTVPSPSWGDFELPGRDPAQDDDDAWWEGHKKWDDDDRSGLRKHRKRFWFAKNAGLPEVTSDSEIRIPDSQSKAFSSISGLAQAPSSTIWFSSGRGLASTFRSQLKFEGLFKPQVVRSCPLWNSLQCLQIFVPKAVALSFQNPATTNFWGV